MTVNKWVLAGVVIGAVVIGFAVRYATEDSFLVRDTVVLPIDDSVDNTNDLQA